MLLDPHQTPPPRAILFDIDGTLVDSVDFHAAAWQETLRRFGYEADYHTVRLQIGKGGDRLLEALIGTTEMQRRGREIKRASGALFAERYLPLVRAIPGVRPLLEDLRSRGLKLALASACERRELDHYKKLLNISDLLDAAVCGDEVERSKPDPEVFRRALAKLGLAGHEAIAVGDTPYDAEAAGKAGLATIGVLSGFFPRRGLEQAGCIAIYADISALQRALERSPAMVLRAA